MKATIYIPYANGDCVRGFRYEGKDLSKEEYKKLITDEYMENKDSIDYMVGNYLGYNISKNPFQKVNRKYKQQTYIFHECPCELRNINGEDLQMEELNELHRTKDKTVLMVYLDPKTVHVNTDLETDINQFIRDSLKVKNCPVLTDDEVLMTLPKKDFKVSFKEDKSTAVLKDCRLLERINKSNVRMALLVDRVVFVKS